MLENGSKVFGNWTVEEKLGSGSFGTVYKIKREEFGKVYYAAMKVLKIPQDTDEQKRLRSEGMDDASISSYYGQVVQNFIKEIELLSSLDGITNIVDYKDHLIEENGDFGYTIYIKMQLLQPLSEKILSGDSGVKFLTAKEVVNIGVDICSALEVCEKHNIIHRDIKIDNIFMSSNGDYKLGDFGIARQLEATQGEMSQKGTLSYMAPEIYRGDDYDKTVDIYSLGLLLYRLLNKNRAPFLPEYPSPITFTAKEMANVSRLRGEAIPDIKGISKALNDIVLKACEFSPIKRFQSATEMKRALLALDAAILDSLNEIPEDVSATADVPSFEKEDEITIELENTPADEGTTVFNEIEEENEGTTILNEIVEEDEGTTVLNEIEEENDGTTLLNESKAEVKSTLITNRPSQLKTIVETSKSSNPEFNVGKKKSKKKFVVPVVIILIWGIIAGCSLYLLNFRCYNCGSVMLPGTECEWCDNIGVDYDESDYEYSDDVYGFSNQKPEGISDYEDEGYYVTWYEDSNQTRINDGVSGCTFDELVDNYEELKNWDLTPGQDIVGAYELSEDEFLCIAFYQYRWVL